MDSVRAPPCPGQDANRAQPGTSTCYAAPVTLEFRHEVLLAARLELGLTQEQTAQALRIDVRTYRRYEAGTVNDAANGFSVRRAARRQLLARIGEELGIATEELVQPRVEAEAEAEPLPSETPSNAALARWATHHAHVLQPALHFVGRDEELSMLEQWASASPVRPRIQAVVAVGGAGKSALAGQVVERLGDDGSRAVFVWSFYENDRAESFVAAAVQVLDSSTPSSAPLENLDRLLSLVASPIPHLLVLDGVEVMQSDGRRRPRGSILDPHLRRLLSTVAARPGGTRILLTSRYPLIDLQAWEGDGLHTLRLPPLPDAAQLELLQRWGVSGTQAQLRMALERYGGHALSVATLASYVAGFYEGTVAAMTSIDLAEAAEDDLLAFRLARLLTAYSAAMTETQRDLVARVSAFPRGATLDALLALGKRGGALGGRLPTDRRGLVQALSRLEAMGVLYRNRADTSVFAVHPFVADHFREHLGATTAALHDAERHRLLARLQERPNGAPATPQLELLEDLLDHTLLAGEAQTAFSIYQRAIGGFNHLGLRRGDMARGLRISRMFLVDGDPSRPRGDLEASSLGQLLYELSLYASAVGEPDYARTVLQAFVDRGSADARERTTGWRTMAYVLRLQGRVDEAMEAIERALRIGEQEPDHVVRNLGLRAAILHDGGELEAAAQSFAAANAIDPHPRFRRALWEAELLVDMGEREAACAMTQSNRDECEARSWGGHLSHCDVVLGRCIAPEDPERAAEFLQQAQRWASVSGEVEAQLRCSELELVLASTDAEIDATMERARSLIEAAGMHRFAARLRPQTRR